MSTTATAVGFHAYKLDWENGRVILYRAGEVEFSDMQGVVLCMDLFPTLDSPAERYEAEAALERVFELTRLRRIYGSPS